MPGKHLSSDDADAGTEAGSSQQRIESTEPSVGHIAGAVVAVLLIIAIVLVIVSCQPTSCNYRLAFCEIRVKFMNFIEFYTVQ